MGLIFSKQRQQEQVASKEDDTVLTPEQAQQLKDDMELIDNDPTIQFIDHKSRVRDVITVDKIKH